MDIIVGFFVALFKLIFTNVFSILATYLIVLLAIRLFGFWKIKENDDKPICPRCNTVCSRIQKSSIDELRTYLSLKIMRWKRFTCYTCYWEGSRW